MQNSFTQLESKQTTLAMHGQLPIRNQSVDQAKVFQKKQSYTANNGQVMATQAMNQLIPLLQQQLVQVKASNQGRQQHIAHS
jgi:hypothetical protein